MLAERRITTYVVIPAIICKNNGLESCENVHFSLLSFSLLSLSLSLSLLSQVISRRNNQLDNYSVEYGYRYMTVSTFFKLVGLMSFALMIIAFSVQGQKLLESNCAFVCYISLALVY